MFRILSIDGGGIKGSFPASFLSALEEKLHAPITTYFDLIAGTSTGGIIALGLGLGLPPSDILRFYTEKGSSIFPESQRWSRRVRHYIQSKYSPDPLKKALTEAFGARLLGESTKRLVIPSFSALTGKIYVYKTAHHERFESDWRKQAVEVAMATSAAPSYFPPHITSSYIAHLDGGMWANNPTGNAVAEAIGVLKVPATEIRVLSLGCTRIAQSFTLGQAGLIGWRKKALDASFSGQSFGSMGIASVLIGHPNIQRVDPVVEEGKFELDDNRYLNELVGCGEEYAREELPRFRQIFGGEPAADFIPFYGSRALANVQLDTDTAPEGARLQPCHKPPE